MSSLPLKPQLPCIENGVVCGITYGMAIRVLGRFHAFLYARLFGDRDTDLGGNEIFMRPPKVLVDTKVVAEGVVWKIKKALYGLRTSPIAWETERDNTLRSLKWVQDD